MIFQGREYYLNMPLNDNKPYPLVMCLHGGTGNGGTFRNQLGITDTFKDSAIVCYPTATLNAAGDTAWNSGGAFNTGDDVGYLVSLIEMIKAAKKVTDVYIVGYSNGAMMGYRLIIEKPNLFKGLLSIAGDVMVDNTDTYTGNILHIHGRLDENVPFEGGMGINGIEYPSVQSELDKFTVANVSPVIMLNTAGHPLSEIKSAFISEEGVTLQQTIYNFVR